MMITKLKLMVGATALVLGGLSGFAFAKGHAEKAETRTERKAAMLAKFDTNKDGKLDRAERQAKRDLRVEKRFAMLDANNDGVITLVEMKAAKHGRGHRKGFHGRDGRTQ